MNMDFAPVLDVNNNPRNPVIGTRSYGEHPEEVARLGLAAADGLREGGVAPCAKHFAGPSIPHDLARLRSVELVPFKAAIAAGFPAIMTSHIIFPDLDPDLPAT